MAHYQQATTLLRRSREMQRICGELEAVLNRLGLPDRSVLALADAANGYKVRNPTYRNVADVSDAVAGRDLKALVEAGLLEPKGRNRGRYYTASQTVMAIKAKAAEPKDLPNPFDYPDTLQTNLALPGVDMAIASKTSSTWPPPRS